MASIFRSEEMALCQLFVSNEASYNCVSELGEIGLVQFRDLNVNVNAFQRKFVHELRRCEEMERKLRYLETEALKDDIPVTDTADNPIAPQPREMIDFEATFEKLETELKEVNTNAEMLKRNFLELTELKYVLQISQVFFNEHDEPSSNLDQTLIPAEEGTVQGGPVQLGFVAGVISRKRAIGFERMLWRVSRGNAFVRQQDIDVPLEDPATGERLDKVAFLVFFQGEQLKSKVKKICDGCKATTYPCPESPHERKEMIQGVSTRLQDLSMVLAQTTDHRHRVLVSASRQLRSWLIKVRKMKGIYYTLNMFNFDVTNKCLIAEAWIPEKDLHNIKTALAKATERSGSALAPILNRMEVDSLSPPTFHRQTKFTSGFQALIDAYGVCTYTEINPGLYTTTTFPFLFAVMFGDLGHGLLMTAFASYMLIREKAITASKNKNEIWRMMFGGRYILFLMGLFSMYTGLIYNDVFSKSINIFGSSYHAGPGARLAVVSGDPDYMLDPGNSSDYVNYPYPFGVDPIWQLSVNKIAFLNSYKMKISVIIGVLHMLFGIILSLLNHVHFRRPLNIVCEFIPQVIFLMGLFGYLCFMVLFKWANYGSTPVFPEDKGPRCAPSVLILFIDMALFTVNPALDKDMCKTGYMFTGQYTLQVVLVVICVICVPILLIPKPIVLLMQNNKRKRQLQAISANDIHSSTAALTTNDVGNGSPSTSPDGGVSTVVAAHEEEFEFSEVFIHQAIHTIEFVLGCVSHTASYLRLWALSLAHAQLSDVLWTMVFKIGLAQASSVGCIMLYIIFAAWAFLTVSILVVMEGLSAFLHTLRLHWVEFCSKFLHADGYLFEPFAFKSFVEEEED